MDVEHLAPQTLNLRLLLWRRMPSASAWVDLLHRESELSVSRCQRLIEGVEKSSIPTAAEGRTICAALGAEYESFATAPMLDLPWHDMLVQNVRYLLQDLPKGTQKAFAAALGVAPETVSRWVTGRHLPGPRYRKGLLGLLGLPASIDLGHVPVFLSLDPVGALQQRAWIGERVESLEPTELAHLFPALQKLLRA